VAFERPPKSDDFAPNHGAWLFKLKSLPLVKKGPGEAAEATPALPDIAMPDHGDAKVHHSAIDIDKPSI
jgi:hypothetical protein